MLIEPMIARLNKAVDLSSSLEIALADAVSLQGAEFGNIQFCGENGELLIVAQRRLPLWFIEQCGCLMEDATTVCARALRNRETVCVRDVFEDEDFRPYLHIAERVGFRGVLSSPLIAHGGNVLGIISTHFANPHRPTAIEIASLEEFCPIAANYIFEKIDGSTILQTAEQLFDRLLHHAAASSFNAEKLPA